MLRKIYLFLAFVGGCALAAQAINLRDPKMHCAEDTVRVNALIGDLRQNRTTLGEEIVYAAESFVGCPADDYYRTDTLADLRINLDSFTPLMLVNNSIALARAARTPGMADWRPFTSELEKIACRKGEDKGFPSIMYHTSDWIGDNSARGNVREFTEDFAGVEVRTKSLDEMTRNRNNYAVLSDSSAFETVRMTEMGFRTHRIPTLKREAIKKKEIVEDLQAGDILILVPYGEGKDFYDLGIITLEQDGPHLIHLSPQTHKVEKEAEPLARYLGPLAKYYQGIRLVRVKD